MKKKQNIIKYKCLDCYKQFILDINEEKRCIFCESVNIKIRG